MDDGNEVECDLQSRLESLVRLVMLEVNDDEGGVSETDEVGIGCH